MVQRLANRCSIVKGLSLKEADKKRAGALAPRLSTNFRYFFFFAAFFLAAGFFAAFFLAAIAITSFLVDGAPGQSTFVKVISAAHTSLRAHPFQT